MTARGGQRRRCCNTVGTGNEFRKYSWYSLDFFLDILFTSKNVYSSFSEIPEQIPKCSPSFASVLQLLHSNRNPLGNDVIFLLNCRAPTCNTRLNNSALLAALVVLTRIGHGKGGHTRLGQFLFLVASQITLLCCPTHLIMHPYSMRQFTESTLPLWALMTAPVACPTATDRRPTD